MKRKNMTFNARHVRVGRRTARWVATGMNFSQSPRLERLKATARAIARDLGLCEALGRSVAYHATEFVDPVSGQPWFANQSGCAALVRAIRGDHIQRIAMIEALHQAEDRRYS